MSYYNPRVYNYSNLNSTDQLIVRNDLYIIESIKNMKYDYDTDMNTSSLERIFNETANEVIDEVIECINYDIVEFIVASIDDYDHDVEEYDTDNYLYGIKDEY